MSVTPFINSLKFGCKIQTYLLKNGDKTYYIFYKDEEGKRVRTKIGRASEGINENTCIQKYNSTVMNIRHGEDLSIKKSIKLLKFDTLAMKYFCDKELHNKSNESSKLIYIKHIKPFIGPHSINKLSDSSLLDLQKIYHKYGYSAASSNRTITLVKTILNHAIKSNMITTHNCKNGPLIKCNNARDRILSKSEVHNLYDLLKDEKIGTLMFAYLSLSTGARAESILSIQMKHINFDNKTILLYDFKREINYMGILSNDVLYLLNIHFSASKANIYLTSNKKKKLSYSAMYVRFKKILKPFNEGILKRDRKNKAVMHTFRHTFGSHLTMEGENSIVVQGLMNHADEKMTKRYTHLHENTGAKKVNSMYQKG